MPTVLVVDDSEVDRRVTGSWIPREIDAKILYARDGVDALQQVEAHHPDLVITDLQMPSIDGLQLLATLKENCPWLPVILVTAKGSETIAAEALRRGAASYVPKRSLARDLSSTIIQVLNAARDDLGHSMLMHCMNRNESSFTLFGDIELIKTLVRHFQEMLRCLPLGDETERLRVGIALHEALLNAYYRGNLEIGGTVPRRTSEDFTKLVDERRSQIPYSDRRIYVDVTLDRESVKCVVRDEGSGFDISQISATLSAEKAESGGRGIILMHTIMDEVHYNESGNEVTMIKRREMDEVEDGDD